MQGLLLLQTVGSEHKGFNNFFYVGSVDGCLRLVALLLVESSEIREVIVSPALQARLLTTGPKTLDFNS